MLITIVDTKTYGRFVLHKYPYEKIHVQQAGFQRLPLGDILQNISQTFDYFAIYRKQSLICTSGKPLPEKAVVEIFKAKEKSSQIVLEIDDGCVLVSRSAYLNRPKANPPNNEAWIQSQNAGFVEINEETQSIINSISVVWRLSSHDGVQEAKHRLSFLLGILERKQQHSQFMTKQINRIMEQKQLMRRRIKDLIILNTKDSSQSYQQIRIKILAKELDQEAARIREKISLFKILKEYYQSWIKGHVFQLREDEGFWEGTIGSRIAIEKPPKNFIKKIEHKTLVMLPPKLAQLLPGVLYSERVRKLYEKAFTYNNISFKKILSRNGQLINQELYHTVYFLLRNNLAVDIYPINHPNSYNLFYLKELPSKNLIEKFNNKIFPGKNFLEVISPYSRYKLAREQEETLKYLLLKDIVGEVKIYIYRKLERQHKGEMAQGKHNDVMLEQLLYKYNMSDIDLNHLLAVQPFPFSSKESNPLTNITKFVRDHSKQWGFYFVE